MASILYGYTRSERGIIVDTETAKNVTYIYDAYLSGASLNGLIKLLHENGVLTPSGKERWSTAVLHSTLTDSRYIPIVGFEKYTAAQFEVERRSQTDEYTGTRKTTRYHSGNVLSGLCICGECGRSYRRVQRASGEMVWRCANRVEHGTRICKSSPTITEQELTRFVYGVLNTTEVDLKQVRDSIESIIVNSDGTLIAVMNTPELLMTLL